MPNELRPPSMVDGYGFVTNLPRTAGTETLHAAELAPSRGPSWFEIACFFAAGFVAGSAVMRIALALAGHRGAL